MSKYWGVHNDEDEVAYSSEQPKLRYENKQYQVLIYRKKKGHYFSRVYATLEEAVAGRDAYLASLENKFAAGLGEDRGGVVDVGQV